MMAHGIFVAVAVSLAWIVLQNLLMHFRPAENRFKTMVVGYLLSLPFVLVAYRWMPPLASSAAATANVESPALGLFHAYLFHCLLFLCYGECFYHVERSVTLRLLLELHEHRGEAAPLQAIQERYPVEGMIRERLEVLRDRGLIEGRGDLWHLRSKGTALARVTVAAAWLFQFKGQHERLDALDK
jgi:hypothetical protein